MTAAPGARPLPRLIGMVHLAPLPGSPGYGGSIDVVVDQAVADARALTAAGFPALMVENFGDAPFHPETVPPITVAAVTRAAAAIRQATAVPLGINVLRNDGLAAISIAAACGAGFVRVNVLSGTMYADQGPIVGRAADITRLRASLAPDLTIMADVFVKHAVPPPGLTLEQATADLWERGGADAVVVSGAGTGRAVDLDDLRRVRAAAPEAPIVVGSGATPDTLSALFELSDAIIVGTALKEGGRVTSRVDPARAASFVTAAGL